MFWYRCPDSPLGFYLVPEHLPLWGSAPLTGASACLSSLLVYSWGWVSRVRHGLGFVDACSGCWLVLVPAVFWTLPWVLPSRFQVGCWLEVVGVSPSLSSLRNLAVEGVDMVLCQVLVGLPSWCCCASGLQGLVVFLFFLLGHLSQVRSVFFLSPRPCRGFPSFGWVGFWS